MKPKGYLLGRFILNSIPYPQNSPVQWSAHHRSLNRRYPWTRYSKSNRSCIRILRDEPHSSHELVIPTLGYGKIEKHWNVLLQGKCYGFW